MEADRYYRHRRLCMGTMHGLRCMRLLLDRTRWHLSMFCLLFRSWLNTVDVVSVEKIERKQTDSIVLRTQLQTENGYLIK